MKCALLAFGILIVTLANGTRAEAQNYPWCEYMMGWAGGGKNCGFVSFEQCMESARGNGSDCRVNTLYTPPPGPHSHATRKPPKNS
jgi:hypothetical protein